MKLKEWGLMRHKPRRTMPASDDDADPDASQPDLEEQMEEDRESSVTIEPMSIEMSPAISSAETAVYHITAAEGVEVMPTFMSLLGRTRVSSNALDLKNDQKLT